MDVKQIEAKDTLELRSAILRDGLDVAHCYFDHDHDENTFHLGAFVNDKLASVASFYLEKHPEIEGEYQYRLRGMATLEKFQGQGLSRALLRTAFPMIRQNHVFLVWCNARVSAIGFYEKVGFQIRSEKFEIQGVGPHVVMSIDLSS